MPGKPRVHELAKELGVESKTVLAKLKELGEFVKSASSTLEPPVARKLREAFPAGAGTPNPARPRRAAPPVQSVPSVPTPAPAPAEIPTQAVPSPDTTAPRPVPGPVPAAPRAEEAAAPEAPVRRPVPGPVRPSPQRIGNNPFTTQEPEDRPRTSDRPRPGPVPGAPRPGAPRPGPVPGAPRPGAGGPRPGPVPGAPRPGAPRPGAPRPGAGAPRPGQGAGSARPGAPRPGAPRPASSDRPRPSSDRPAGAGTAPSRPAGQGARPSSGTGPGTGAGPGGGGGRPAPGGRGRGGGAAGAFGRPGGKPGRARKSKKQKRQEFEELSRPGSSGVGVPKGDGAVVRLPQGASLSDFAERIGANPGTLVQVMFGLGEMVTATQACTDETLQLLGAELEYDVQVVSPEEEDRLLLARFHLEEHEATDESLTARPPVVTVMGHVDHGKTRLLDAIRHANVQASEAGGITQHIGAYQVRRELGGEERAITFVDTPGHEAFTAMRARGAKVTDVAVLVVAADDGVKPQTIEALNHAQAAQVPIVVAVNKVDKEGADPGKVRAQLTEYGLVAEEYGGDTLFVDVSALTGAGIGDLLEAVLLTADATLDLRADAGAPANGVAIEAHLDKGRGPVATVLVQEGTLEVGDPIVVGGSYGRVRAMLDEHGGTVERAEPARPVLVLGLTTVPRAGDRLLVVPEERTARQVAEQRQVRERSAQLARSRSRVTLEQILERIEQGKVDSLNLVLKGDVSGSVEAVEDALLKLDVGEQVDLRIIHRGVGAVTENDVTLASASGAIVIGFNVRAEGKARELAEREHVDVRYYSVIYSVIEDVESALKGMLKPEYEEVSLGEAEVRAVFRSSKFGSIAGCIVRSGRITRNSSARLVRDGTVVAENLKVDSLRREKDDVTEVREGFECGINLGNFNDVKEGDVLETYEMREKPRT